MQHATAFLQNLHRLMTDDGFALSMLAVVAGAAVLAFGFGATSDIVAPLLVLGVVTVLVERKLRAVK